MTQISTLILAAGRFSSAKISLISIICVPLWLYAIALRLRLNSAGY